MNASEKLLEALLARGDALKGLADGELLNLLSILETAHEQVLGKIAATSGAWTKQWLLRIKEDIDTTYATTSAEILRTALNDLQPLAGEEVAWIADTFTRTLPGLPLNPASTLNLWAMIEALPASEGSTLAQLSEALGINNAAAVTREIQLSMSEGENLDQLVRRLRGNTISPARWMIIDGVRTYKPGQYEGGTMTTNTRETEMFARTAVMHVGNQARETYYQANSDLIKGFMRVETLDTRTCIECGVSDGRQYSATEPRPSLPSHPSCRGLWLPILKSYRELGVDLDELPPGTRASMDGKVPQYTTWKDMLKNASQERQELMLGVSRSRLYREGMNVDDMVKDGKVVPLKSLGVKKEKAA